MEMEYGAFYYDCEDGPQSYSDETNAFAAEVKKELGYDSFCAVRESNFGEFLVNDFIECAGIDDVVVPYLDKEMIERDMSLDYCGFDYKGVAWNVQER